MAGNYPDVPAPRMAYDRDGSVGALVTTGGGISLLSGGQLATINDEDSDELGWTPATTALCIIFPELRDVAAYVCAHNSSDGTVPGLVDTSINTTNGFDGTWVSRGTWVRTSIGTGLRTAINTISWTGVKAVRFHGSGGNFGGSNHTQALHLFGSITAGQNPDRLRMWHPTLDEPLDDSTSADGAFFDWGDIQRNTTSDKTFRIKNNSATLTANSIVISQETLSDTSPTVNSQFTFSDGGAFAASIDIGNLAPGALSPVITKRFARPSNAILSLWTSRTIANPTSWT
jgi:hypothetical protein